MRRLQRPPYPRAEAPAKAYDPFLEAMLQRPAHEFILDAEKY
jgi:hypothetical protein